MSDYLEAILLMIPLDAGGRRSAIEPREGSYRPFARIGGATVRLRVIEGPARLAPGDAARVVVEIESPLRAELTAGEEVRVLEHDARVAGVLTVVRHLRRAIAV